MSISPITCPYCNSLAPTPSSLANGQRLVCGRCGESFLFRTSDDLPQISPGPEAVAVAPVPPPVTLGRRWTNRGLGLTVLAGMLAVAAVTATFVLLTIGLRRSNDPRELPQDSSKQVQAIAPRHLTGLGYLPQDVTVVAGLHVAEAMQEPAGREFLRHFRPTDFVKLPKQAADNLDSGNLEQWTGLSLDEIDHVVLGATIENVLLPRLYLIVQTRKPYDADKIKSQLKAVANPRPGPRQVLNFDMENLPLPGTLWFAGQKTFVVGLLTEHLDAIPSEPVKGLGHVSPAVREVIEERIVPSAQAWFVGHADDWNKTAGKLLLPTLSKDVRPMLEKVRTLGLWLTIQEGLTLNSVVNCADEETAAKWDGYLMPKEGERKPIRLFGDRPALEPVAKELAATLKSVRHETWLTIQAKAKADTVQQALSVNPPR